MTDDPEDIAKIAAFAADLGNVERVDVLPFHQMGRYKWKKLGIRTRSRTLSLRTPELVDPRLCVFHAVGLKTH